MVSGTFKTSDGTKLHTADAPVVGAKGNVYIVHGIGEHIGRYTHVFQYLNGRGYGVFGHDHRGHGQSEGERVYFDSFDIPVRDLKARVDSVRADHPGVKMFMLGHSMGSLISTLYMQRYEETMTGWISTGSPLCVDKTIPAPVAFLLRGLAKVAPKLKLLPVKPETVSRDPAVVAAYQNDPYVNHEKTKLGMVVNFAKALAEARSKLAKITLPALIMHGTGDMLCPPEGSDILYNGISSQDKTLKTYPDFYHELHNEPEQGEVLAYIGDWLNEHV